MGAPQFSSVLVPKNPSCGTEHLLIVVITIIIDFTLSNIYYIVYNL